MKYLISFNKDNLDLSNYFYFDTLQQALDFIKGNNPMDIYNKWLDEIGSIYICECENEAKERMQLFLVNETNDIMDEFVIK